jgi:fermentation-respiration switch protein FrsA (DUF1100 family)
MSSSGSSSSGNSSSSIIDQETDWVTFYKSLGCDVLLYNYRGFGRSGGTPSPKVLQVGTVPLVNNKLFS